ncbi:MAG: condensation domain-containing protein, partial [Patescibacteria group bacterium]
MADFLRETGEALFSAYENQDYPYDLILDLARNGDPGRNPLFDLMLILHNELETHETTHLGGVALRRLAFATGTAKLDIKLDFYPKEGGYDALFEYNTDLYDRKDIERFADHYLGILRAIAADPGRSLGGIELMSGEERSRVLGSMSGTFA